MNAHTRRERIAGPVGDIEIAIDAPAGPPRGTAIVAHPHPLFGGTLDNKVAQTLARATVASGFLSVRPNFRGVGATAGEHDRGVGEVDDLLAVTVKFALPNLPLVLAGFSFGSYVQSRVAQRLSEHGLVASRLVLVGTPAGKWPVPEVPSDTLVVHGELDETIALAQVLAWARPQELPVVVVPGADHFFHRRLTVIKRLVVDALAERVVQDVEAA